MASTVMSAAVAARRNIDVGSLALINPFKGRVMCEEESLEGRAARSPELHIPNYGSVDHPRPKGGLFPSATRRGQGFTEHVGDTDIGSGVEADHDAAETDFADTPMSYHRIIRLYSLVPMTALLTILFFVLLLRILRPSHSRSPSFASYLGLSFGGAAAWVVSFALRIPIYLVSSLTCRSAPLLTPFVSSSLQVFVEESLRLSSLVLVHVRLHGTQNPTDTAFPRVWTVALGWAAAEVAVSVWQGYEQLALYRDRMTPVNPTFPKGQHSPDTSARSPDEQSTMLESADTQGYFLSDPEEVMTEEIDQIIRIRTRIELEVLYGIPVPDIPVFVSCLLRIDSIVLSFALFLIISSSYLSYLSQSTPSQHHLSPAIMGALPTFIVVFVLRTILSFSWTLCVLPQIGLHAASYISCIFALGALFVGLGRWDAV